MLNLLLRIVEFIIAFFLICIVVKYTSLFGPSVPHDGNGGTGSNQTGIYASVCSTPRGTSIPVGDTVTAYLDKTVASGKTCVSQQRLCNEYGILEGSFVFPSCTTDDSSTPPTARSCRTPWGALLTNGQQTVAYQSSVAYNTTCVGEYRTCNDGRLQGSYQHQSCSVLLKGNRMISLPFLTLNVKKPDPLIQPVRIDTSTQKFDTDGKRIYGPLSGTVNLPVNRNQVTLTGSFHEANRPGSCLTPRGSWVEDGDSVSAYATTRGFKGSECSYEVRKCFGWALNGSYQYDSCTQYPDVESAYADQIKNGEGLSCVTPRNTQVQDGEYIRAYEKTSVPSGQTCNAQIRLCNNGSLSGSYVNQDCLVDQ